MKPQYIILPLLLSTVLAGGCATLNESECRNADWYGIGYEDGVKGNLASRIAKHRQACSKFNITPDFNSYYSGYDQGIRQFCTESQGFYSGRSGYRYEGACPPDIEADFLEGYTIGREFYELGQEIDRADNAISRYLNRIKKLKKSIHKKEQLLVTGTTVEERQHLLDEIKQSQKEIGELGIRIIENEKLKAVLENEYARLRELYYYY